MSLPWHNWREIAFPNIRNVWEFSLWLLSCPVDGLVCVSLCVCLRLRKADLKSPEVAGVSCLRAGALCHRTPSTSPGLNSRSDNCSTGELCERVHQI